MSFVSNTFLDLRLIKAEVELDVEYDDEIEGKVGVVCFRG